MAQRRKIEFARFLRKEQTKAELTMWWLLRNRWFLGYKFRRQYIVCGFILDFYCPTHRLGIELDGPIHLAQVDYDKERQRIIEEQGIKIIRFTNEQLFKQ